MLIVAPMSVDNAADRVVVLVPLRVVPRLLVEVTQLTQVPISAVLPVLPHRLYIRVQVISVTGQVLVVPWLSPSVRLPVVWPVIPGSVLITPVVLVVAGVRNLSFMFIEIRFRLAVRLRLVQLTAPPLPPIVFMMFEAFRVVLLVNPVG